MKKLIVGLLIICLFCCSGCVDSGDIESRAENGKIRYADLSNHITADKETHIIYYCYGSGSEAYMCPYYSKNGKLLRYEDGKIIEVGE